MTFSPLPPFTPVPAGAAYLGTLNGTDYYKYDGTVWCCTPTGWAGVCLISDWPARPEAAALVTRSHEPPLRERTV